MTELLGLYYLDTLGPAEGVLIEAHLPVCPQCRETADQIIDTVASLALLSERDRDEVLDNFGALNRSGPPSERFVRFFAPEPEPEPPTPKNGDGKLHQAEGDPEPARRRPFRMRRGSKPEPDPVTLPAPAPAAGPAAGPDATPSVAVPSVAVPSVAAPPVVPPRVVASSLRPVAPEPVRASERPAAPEPIAVVAPPVAPKPVVMPSASTAAPKAIAVNKTPVPVTEIAPPPVAKPPPATAPPARPLPAPPSTAPSSTAPSPVVPAPVVAPDVRASLEVPARSRPSRADLVGDEGEPRFSRRKVAEELAPIGPLPLVPLPAKLPKDISPPPPPRSGRNRRTSALVQLSLTLTLVLVIGGLAFGALLRGGHEAGSAPVPVITAAATAADSATGASLSVFVTQRDGGVSVRATVDGLRPGVGYRLQAVTSDGHAWPVVNWTSDGRLQDITAEVQVPLSTLVFFTVSRAGSGPVVSAYLGTGGTR